MSKKKMTLIAIVGFLITAQFFKIDKTNPMVNAKDDFFYNQNASPKTVSLIKAACYDCHSNESKYPWYTNIAPISWWIKGHIKGGRSHLNFSIWNQYNEDKKMHKIQENIEVIEEKRMPMLSYMIMHPEGKLNDEQRKDLIVYFKSLK